MTVDWMPWIGLRRGPVAGDYTILTNEEVFDMLSKEDVNSSTKDLLEKKLSFLSEERFPSIIEGSLFWSAVYHYHQSLDGGASPKALLSLYKKNCAKQGLGCSR